MNFIQTNSVDVPPPASATTTFPPMSCRWTGTCTSGTRSAATSRCCPRRWRSIAATLRVCGHNAVVDPAKFWLTQGPGHVATFDAMLDLFPGDPCARSSSPGGRLDPPQDREGVPGPEGHAALQDTIAQHPRIAMLVEQYQRAQKSPGRLKTLWRRLFPLAAPH